MADPRLDPRGLTPGDEGDVMQTVDGVAAWGAFVLPTAPTALVTVINGSPGLVFDNNGQQVFTEGAP
jgi:hypothetical protein